MFGVAGVWGRSGGGVWVAYGSGGKHDVSLQGFGDECGWDEQGFRRDADDAAGEFSDGCDGGGVVGDADWGGVGWVGESEWWGSE